MTAQSAQGPNKTPAPPAGGESEGADSLQSHDGHWAALLVDEWKFRQAHCWRLLQVFGIAAVAVSIAPYLLPDIRVGAGVLALAFPIFGLFVGFVVLALFHSEYKQCAVALRKYRSLQKSAGAEDKYHPYERWRFWLGIGRWLPWVLFILLAAGSFGNALILLALSCAPESSGWACAAAGGFVEWWSAFLGV